MNPIISRARVLIEQNRPDEASKLLMEVLATEPNNVLVLAMLSEIQIDKEQYTEAIELIDKAIAIEPDSAYLYYIKAQGFFHMDKYTEAEEMLQTSISIDPDDADNFALFAHIQLMRKNYNKALTYADEALVCEPDHILALNVRSTALLNLDKKEESYQTIEDALNEDPNNAYTHANFGWNLLRKGEDKKALEHFTEALKIDPNSEYAQAGMAEAIKSKYLIYRWFLMYSLWISSLTERYQWFVLIGYYLAVKGLSKVAKASPELEPYLLPIVALLSIIAFSTWIITPISNLFLRMNKYGKYLLDKNEKISSSFVGVSLLVSIIAVIIYFATGKQQEGILAIAILGFTMMIPFSSMLLPTIRKNVLKHYTLALGLLGLWAVAKAFSLGTIYSGTGTLYIFGLVGFTWACNYFLIKENNI